MANAIATNVGVRSMIWSGYTALTVPSVTTSLAKAKSKAD